MDEREVHGTINTMKTASKPSPAFSKTAIPLCVDLDGTLVKTDMLLESLLALLKRNPFYLFLIPFWLFKGRAHFKHQLARRVCLDVAGLPYHEEFSEFLSDAVQSGRRLILTTASDAKIAHQIADHLQWFEEVLASDGKINLSGRQKLLALRHRFGSTGFDYAGNEKRDLPIWRSANESIVVNGTERLVAKARKIGSINRVFSNKPSQLRSLLRAVRPHQWVKNLLVFVSLLVSHNLTNGALILNAAWSFLAFSLCASSVYLLNDLLDLEADRRHPEKRYRPFAAGDLSLALGMASIPVFLAGSVVVASLLSWNFLCILVLYFLLTVAYSLRLKQIVLVDVILLASLYTIRILGGAVAIDVLPSSWLLSFSMFLFLSLALVKRFSEIQSASRQRRSVINGRDYCDGDLPFLVSMGLASGSISVLVLGLYISSHEVTALYRHPELLWFLCPPMLYWITRTWLLAHRGQMNEDPVVFAVRDKGSYWIGILILALMFLAT